MKNKVIFLLIATLLLSFTACSDSLEGSMQDVLSSVSDNQPLDGGSGDVDYSAYAQLLTENMEEYGGFIVEETYAPDLYYNTAGLCYANLIDFDNNGIMELVTVTVKDENNSIENGQSAIDLYYSEDYDLQSLVNVYTLSSENEVVLFGSFYPSSHGNGGVRFGVEYSLDDSHTYLLESFRSDFETVTYYELQNGASLVEVALTESSFNYESDSFEGAVNGEVVYDLELFTGWVEELYGETLFHPISWLTEEELAELKAINEATYNYLGVNLASDTDSGSAVDIANPLNIDYSPYSALIEAYTLDYNITNISATDYEITGITFDYTHPSSPDDSMLDASGFCYANLVDLDNNGVLELVLIAYDHQEWDSEEYVIYGDTVKLGLLENPDIVKIYTILPETGLHFLGSMEVSYLNMPVSMNYGIEYAVSDDKTYIVHRNLYQMGDGTIYYYGLSDEFYFGPEEIIEIDVEGNSVYGDTQYSFEETEELIEGFGESEIHLLENLNDTYLAELEAVNEATFDFLANYPVADFDDYSGTYNDGQFYFFEYYFHDLYPPEIAVKSYYRALTMRDYDTLFALGISDETLDLMEMRYSPDDPRPYVPGYIISKLQLVTTDAIEKPDLAADIENYIAQNVPNGEASVMHCRVNEVLDPHKSMLGLQVAGGIYDTYFILYSDDPDGLEWKIAEIFDEKFYWD